MCVNVHQPRPVAGSLTNAVKYVISESVCVFVCVKRINLSEAAYSLLMLSSKLYLCMCVCVYLCVCVCVTRA